MTRFFLRPHWSTGLLDEVLPAFFATSHELGVNVEVWSDDTAVHVRAELPGVAEDDLEISVIGDELTLGGERASDRPEDARLLHGERRFGRFRRVLTLPALVDAENVTARLEHGVLSLTLPKAEAERPRRIPLQVSND